MFSQPPSWGAQDRKQLKNLLNRSPNLTLEEFKRRWDVYVRRSDDWIRNNQGYSLGYFASKFDSFIGSPGGSGMRKLELPEWAKEKKEKSGTWIIKADR